MLSITIENVESEGTILKEKSEATILEEVLKKETLISQPSLQFNLEVAVAQA